MPKHVLMSFGLCIIAASPAAAQRDEAALRLLDEAIAAHQPADAPLRATLRFEGQAPAPGQSLTALGPFETFRTRRELIIDEAAKKSALYDVPPIAGFDLEAMYVNTPEGGFLHDKNAKSYRPLQTPPLAVNTLLPHLQIRNVRQNAQSLRLLEAKAGEPPRVAYSFANGGSGTFVFNPASKLLTKVESGPLPRIYGTERFTLSYPAYRRVGGTAVPESYMLKVANPTLGDLVTNVRLVSAIEGAKDEAFVRPADLPAADTSWRKPAFTAEALAPDVYLIHNITGSQGQWSYNVLAVIFEDHVMIAEAPETPAANEKVLAKIEEIAPGKPVRYLVLSHHHDDHIGGIEPYMKRGTTMLTTPDAAKLLGKIAATRGASFGMPKTETVVGRRILKDERNEAHIYDMGANPHSNQMLVVHLPRQGILYQVDMINEGDHPRNRTTDAFLGWMAKQRLSVKTIAGLHGRTVEASRFAPAVSAGQ